MAVINGTDDTARELTGSILGNTIQLKNLQRKNGGTLRGEVKAPGEMPTIVTNISTSTNGTTGEETTNIQLAIPTKMIEIDGGFETVSDASFDDGL